MIKPEQLIQWLGKAITDPEIERVKEDIGHCEVDELDSFVYYSFYKQGFNLQFENNILTTIQLFSEGGAEDYHEYPYPLPHGLSFSSTDNEVRAVLGEPIKTGPDTEIFEFSDHVLYVEFRTKPKTINSLTLMTLEKFAE